VPLWDQPITEQIDIRPCHSLNVTLVRELSVVDKMALLADWIEYCNDEGFNIQRLRAISYEYRESFMGHETTNVITSTTTSTVVGVKRPLEDDTTEQPAAKIARTDFNYPIASTDSSTTADYARYYQNYYNYDYNSYGYGTGGAETYTTDGTAYDPTETTY